MTHDDLGDDVSEPDIPMATGIIDSHMTGRNDSHMTSSYGASPHEEIEIRRRVIRRRRWSDEEKVLILAEAFAMGANRRAVAERHGIAQAQLYIWRKQLMAFPASEGFVPVHVGTPAMTARPPEASSPVTSVEIVLPSGISIRTGATFDPDTMCRLILGLERS